MDDKSAVREGYDELADRYAEERSENPREAEAVASFFESLPESAQILDAGCGQGEPILTRVEESATGVGVDASRGQLRRAAKNAPTGELVQGDITSLPIRAGTFDAVAACHSIIHVPLDQHQAVIDEFARVLRPDGLLFLTAGGTDWSGTNPDWLGSGTEMRWSMADGETTREQLRTAGFSVVEEGAVENGLADEDATFPYFLARRDR